MKKILLVVLLTLCGTGLAFAGFEGTFGIIGGFGPAAEIGLNLQLGYLSPAGTKEKPIPFRWGLLADLGVGLRYKNFEPYGTYKYIQKGYLGEDIERIGTYYMSHLDYNLGLLAEFYFLPFIGAAIGGGVTPGAGEHKSDTGLYDGNLFTPYIRAEIPFLFRWAKLGVGFDYILWDNEPVPADITLPPGYRINLFVRFRGEAAVAFFTRGWLR